MKVRKDVWQTYATYCYTYDAANDQRSAGGVHCYQVRHTRNGWQTRIMQTNGTFTAYSEVTPVEDAVGAAHYATAEQEA